MKTEKESLGNNFERAVIGKNDEVPPREKSRYEWARENIKGKRVLEIGCSSGFALKFFDDSIDYHGIDKDAAIINYAIKNFGNKFEVADINEYDFEAGHWDTIIAFEVLEHMENGIEMAQKLRKYCKNVLISCPYKETPGFWGIHHKIFNLDANKFPGFNFKYITEDGSIVDSPKTPVFLLLGKSFTHVTAAIPTRGRYFTTLPLTIESVITQNVLPNKIIIMDDNPEKERKFLPDIPLYQYLFSIMALKKIEWEVIYGNGIGQHLMHEAAQMKSIDLVWRIDDDEMAEKNVLETLLEVMENDDVGACGSLVLTPTTVSALPDMARGRISDIEAPNPQWFLWRGQMEVEHLHSTFLYRKNIAHFNAELSPIAHREETIFTHEIFRAGKKLIATGDAITWHLRNPEGGVRVHDPKMLEQDKKIFYDKMKAWEYKIDVLESKYIFLDSGLGDHIVFSSILPELRKKFKKIYIACCYPNVFEGMADIETLSLEKGLSLGMNRENNNVYKFMWDRNWTGSLVDAYRELYLGGDPCV